MPAIPFQSIPFHLFLSDSILPHSIPFRSIPQHLLHFHPNPSDSIPFYSVPLATFIHPLFTIHPFVRAGVHVSNPHPAIHAFFLHHSFTFTLYSIHSVGIHACLQLPCIHSSILFHSIRLDYTSFHSISFEPTLSHRLCTLFIVHPSMFSSLFMHLSINAIMYTHFIHSYSSLPVNVKSPMIYILHLRC